MKEGFITEPSKYLALVVDDVELNRELVSDMLGDEFECIEAADGVEAIEQIDRCVNDLSVIMLDLMMPRKSGMEVLEYLYEKGYTAHIPVLIISEERSIQAEQRCIELGAFDFVRKPFNPPLLKQVSKNAVILYQYQRSLAHTVEQQTAELRERNDRLAQMNVDLIDFVSNIVEARSLESGQHVKRVKAYTRYMAEQLLADEPDCGLTPELIEVIVSASAMHDVGKIMIRDSILLKPGKLTADEFANMKNHSAFGCDILENSPILWSEEYRRISGEICRFHHERYDGRGYPDGLKGEEIPLSAQLVAIADVFDALTTERVYKKAFTVDKAYEMILGGECGAFSPRILRCFRECREKFTAQATAG